MKYEMIFGDEKLFDGAPDDCFCVAKNTYDDSMFYKEVDRCLFWLDGKKWKPLQFMSRTPIAMRRIIKEPKRWTWEDKRAGRLPEVGSDVLCSNGKTIYTIEAVNKNENQLCVRDGDDGDLAITYTQHIQPIETPREKYDRERDECIDKLLAKIPPSPITVVPAMKIVYEEIRPFTGDDHD